MGDIGFRVRVSACEVIDCGNLRLPDAEILLIHLRTIKEGIEDNDIKRPVEKKRYYMKLSILCSCAVISVLVASIDTIIAAQIGMVVLIISIVGMFVVIKWHVEEMVWLDHAYDRVKRSVSIVELYIQGKRPAIDDKPQSDTIDEDLKAAINIDKNRVKVEKRLNEGKDFLQRFVDMVN